MEGSGGEGGKGKGERGEGGRERGEPKEGRREGGTKLGRLTLSIHLWARNS